MRTATFAVLFCLVLPLPAFAFKGRVVDQQGRPVANAIVSVLGRTGEAITDKEGRFIFQPDPPVPFEILIIDAAGAYSRPILIESLDPTAELLVTVTPLLNESVTVSGSAPSIESTPGSGITSLSGRDRSEEHTSELQSQSNLVCRLLLEKKKKNNT